MTKKMTKKDVFEKAKRMSPIFLMLSLALVQGAYGIQFSASAGGGSGGDSSGSGAVTMNFGLAKGAALNSQITINGASITPTTRVIGPTLLFKETHGVTDNSGKSAQVSVKVVNAPNGLQYDSKVLPYEGVKISTQPSVSAEQWLTVPNADSITCTESASYGSTTTSASLDKATSVTGYYGKAYVDDATVWATETGHVTGPFVGTATVGTLTKTRTPNYGSEYDLSMSAVKGSAPTGTLGYYVNPTLKIQGAVTAAQSGDTINVASGTYTENVNIDKSLAINGAGSDKTTVDGNKAGSVFAIGQNNPNVYVALKGMKIQNGVANYGGGIYDKGVLTVADCTVTGNTAVYTGGGISTSGTTAKLTVSNSQISGNSAKNGGGIYSGGTATVSGSAISGNSATGSGAGMYILTGQTATISDSIFSNNLANLASGYGGGVYNLGTVTLSRDTFSGNSASYGGGISNYKIATVLDSTFSNNLAGTSGSETSGGAISNYGASANLAVQRSTFNNNLASYVGGAISNTRSATATVSDSTFTGNSAHDGGAIQNEGVTGEPVPQLTVTNSNFYSNSGYYGGAVDTMTSGNTVISGGIFTGNSAYSGGGICSGSGGTTSISGSTISGNSATWGGGVYQSAGTISISGSTISGNTANYGGGLAFMDGSSATVSSSTITGNKANIRGGGIGNEGGITKVLDSTISRNTAINGGGIFNWGKLSLGGKSQIVNNIATTGSGGGIYSALSSSSTTFDGAGVAVNYNTAHLPTTVSSWYRGWGVYSDSNVPAPITLNGFDPTKQVIGNTKA